MVVLVRSAPGEPTDLSAHAGAVAGSGTAEGGGEPYSHRDASRGLEEPVAVVEARAAGWNRNGSRGGGGARAYRDGALDASDPAPDECAKLFDPGGGAGAHRLAGWLESRGGRGLAHH